MQRRTHHDHARFLALQFFFFKLSFSSAIFNFFNVAFAPCARLGLGLISTFAKNWHDLQKIVSLWPRLLSWLPVCFWVHRQIYRIIISKCTALRTQPQPAVEFCWVFSDCRWSSATENRRSSEVDTVVSDQPSPAQCTAENSTHFTWKSYLEFSAALMTLRISSTKRILVYRSFLGTSPYTNYIYNHVCVQQSN